MNFRQKILSKIVKSTAEMALKRDANSTTCVSFYQPKPPADLKKFKEASNDYYTRN